MIDTVLYKGTLDTVRAIYRDGSGYSQSHLFAEFGNWRFLTSYLNHGRHFSSILLGKGNRVYVRAVRALTQSILQLNLEL